MKAKRLIKWTLWILALGVVAMAPGCGKKEQMEAAKEKRLHLNLADDPVSLDPRLVRSLRDLTVVKQLFEGLTRLNAEHQPELALAKQVDISEDLLTYTFSLKESSWSNGDPVTAQDFVASWREILSPHFATDYFHLLYPIKNGRAAREGSCSSTDIGVEAMDCHTLRVTLEAPTPYFLELTAFPTYFPAHCSQRGQKELQKDGYSHLISNGPFRLKHWQPQNELLLEKNPLYWDATQVALETLAFSMIADSTTESHLFDKGELDWLGQPLSTNITTERLEHLQRAHLLQSYPIAGTFWFQFNTTKEPFDLPQIRKAFSYAITRQEIITHILKGSQPIATGILPPSMALQTHGYFQDGNRVEALRLFEEGCALKGWTKETLPKIKLHYSPSERNTKIVQLVQQQLREALDVEVELEAVEYQLYRRQLREGDYQMGAGEWIADFNDPLAFLDLFKYKKEETGSGMNDTYWYREDYSKLLEESLTEKDPEKRQGLLRRAETLLMEEMPVAPLYHYCFNYIKKPYVDHVLLSPLGLADFKHASLLP